MESDKLKEIASQLRKPDGSKGLEIAAMMENTNAGMIRQSFSLLDLQSDEFVLELGPGNGFHVNEIFSIANIKKYCGLEISSLMLEASITSNKKFINSGKAEFRLYDGKAIPYPDGYFDKIFTVNTIYFWESPLDFLKELKRVLHPEGLLKITFADKSFMQWLPFTAFGFKLYDLEEVKDLAEKAGLKIKFTKSGEEEVKAKTGELVTRKFLTIGLGWV